MKPDKSNYIPTLDGWRAIAIVLVLVEHAASCVFRPVGWSQLGGHGVEIFFVISGYLITGKLLEDGSLRKFYLRRVFRILPVLLAYLAVAGVIGPVLHRIPLFLSEVAASLLFVRNYCWFPLMTKTGAGWFTGHLWSLSIEEQFYLVWPIVLLKVGKGTLRRQMLAAMLLFALGSAMLVLIFVGRTWHVGGWHWLPNVKFAGLVIGCVLRIAFSDADATGAITKVFSGRSMAVVVALFAYIAIFYSRVTIFDPLICGVALCATLVEPNAWIGRLLELPVLRWIGRLSYSLYIWQQLFLGFGTVYRPFGFFSVFPANVASAVAVSCLSYYLMERPMMRLGHRLTATPLSTR